MSATRTAQRLPAITLSPRAPSRVDPFSSPPRPRIEITKSSNKKIKIIVVADLICVWCYIAFKELNQAIDDIKHVYSSPPSSRSSTPTATTFLDAATLSPSSSTTTLPEFDVEYRPFFINTTAGSQDEPVDRIEYLQSRFGKERMTEMHDVAAKRGKEVGIDFQFNAKMRQTVRVHRLLFLAYCRGGMQMQQNLLSLLFRDFFEQPEFIVDPTSVDQLADYAVEIGLIPDRSAAVRWLESRAGEEDVKRLAKISSDCGISGVPFTVVQGKWAIGGGMERGIYYKTIEKLIASDEMNFDGCSDASVEEDDRPKEQKCPLESDSY